MEGPPKKPKNRDDDENDEEPRVDPYRPVRRPRSLVYPVRGGVALDRPFAVEPPPRGREHVVTQGGQYGRIVENPGVVVPPDLWYRVSEYAAHQLAYESPHGFDEQIWDQVAETVDRQRAIGMPYRVLHARLNSAYDAFFRRTAVQPMPAPGPNIGYDEFDAWFTTNHAAVRETRERFEQVAHFLTREALEPDAVAWELRKATRQQAAARMADMDAPAFRPPGVAQATLEEYAAFHEQAGELMEDIMLEADSDGFWSPDDINARYANVNPAVIDEAYRRLRLTDQYQAQVRIGVLAGRIIRARATGGVNLRELNREMLQLLTAYRDEFGLEDANVDPPFDPAQRPLWVFNVQNNRVAIYPFYGVKEDVQRAAGRF